MSMRAALLLALALLALPLFASCGDGASGQPAVTVEPLASPTRAAVPAGGKPAGPPPATPTVTAPAAAEPTPADPPPADAPPATPAPPPAPTATPQPPGPPASGRWIDVDVTNYVVRLMDGGTVLQELAPVGVGVAIDTGDYVSTQTGLFYVHTKDERLVYDAPYDTYISHWVGFDPEKDNGFHSFLKDQAGVVVDASTGRVSNGCIRVGDIEALFAYAELGMPVWVHW